MRTTIVPAQITTVEDKIAGSLNLTQIFLLMTPVFFGSIIYFAFPPRLHSAVYKLLLIAFIVLFCCVLAIRLKGKVLIEWFVILLRYSNRPRYFISNKNDAYQRETFFEESIKKQPKPQLHREKQIEIDLTPQIALSDRIKLEHFLPYANLRIAFKKMGSMYVSLTEIKK